MVHVCRVASVGHVVGVGHVGLGCHGVHVVWVGTVGHICHVAHVVRLAANRLQSVERNITSGP